jgi:hypothetical protein
MLEIDGNKNCYKRLVKFIVMLAVVGIFVANAAVMSAQDVDHSPEPASTFFLLHLFDYDDSYNGDITKLSFSTGAWTLKLDLNAGAQDEYCIDYNAVNTDKSQLKLSLLGSIEDTINDERHVQTYDFSVDYIRQVGKLPLFGKSSLRLYHYSSLKKGAGVEQKHRIALFSDHIDIVYQLMRDRDSVMKSHYFLTYHNKAWALTFGKGIDKKWTVMLLSKKAPVWHISVWDYYNESKKLWGITYSAFKKGDSSFYNQVEADLTVWLWILGDKDVNMPIFPSPLSFGDLSHGMEVTSTPEELRVSNQVGVRIAERIGVGGGIFLKRLGSGPLILSPIISSYLKIPIHKHTVFIEGKYEDKKLSFYAYLLVQF